MNQSILFNDDYSYIEDKGIWTLSAYIAGHKIIIHLETGISPQELNQSLKFDWEAEIEEYFEGNELDDAHQVLIDLRKS